MPSAVVPTRYASSTAASSSVNVEVMSDGAQSMTYASIAKYSASPRRSSVAAVSLLRASTRCQNSRSSWVPGKGAEDFFDWCLLFGRIMSLSLYWEIVARHVVGDEW